MKKICFFLFIIVLINVSSKFSFSQNKITDDTWNKFNFLIGDWEGETKGQPGEGKGYVNFKYDLDKNILIRKDHNEFPATSDRPAFNHDGILIVYMENSKTPDKAVYWDNEGHTIFYDINFSEDGKSIIFASKIIQGLPTQRLTYEMISENVINTRFELAMPNEPDKFTVHVEGKSKRITK